MRAPKKLSGLDSRILQVTTDDLRGICCLGYKRILDISGNGSDVGSMLAMNEQASPRFTINGECLPLSLNVPAPASCLPLTILCFSYVVQVLA
jgi:hypothetical protein